MHNDSKTPYSALGADNMPQSLISGAKAKALQADLILYCDKRVYLLGFLSRPLLRNSVACRTGLTRCEFHIFLCIFRYKGGSRATVIVMGKFVLFSCCSFRSCGARIT